MSEPLTIYAEFTKVLDQVNTKKLCKSCVDQKLAKLQRLLPEVIRIGRELEFEKILAENPVPRPGSLGRIRLEAIYDRALS